MLRRRERHAQSLAVSPLNGRLLPPPQRPNLPDPSPLTRSSTPSGTTITGARPVFLRAALATRRSVGRFR